MELKKKCCCDSWKEDYDISHANSTSSSLSETGTITEEELTTRALLSSINTRLNILDEIKTSVNTISASVSLLSDKYNELLSELKVYKKLNEELKNES